MNVLFIVRDLDDEHPGIMILSSILKQNNHSVDIVEASYSKVVRKLKMYDFQILAYSSVSPTIRYYLNLNLKLKKWFNVLSLFGGPHATYYPEMINEPGVDGVCVGEGDYALLDLVKNLSEGKPINHIPNWWIKQDGKVFRNPPQPLVEDLDSLPFADRTLFPCFDIATMVSTRGCLYRCSFCHQRFRFRSRSADSIVEELKRIKTEKRIRFVVFRDSIFNLSSSWLKEFSEKYNKEISLPFWCNVRADLINPETARYLKEAGCFSVGMGIETANDYLRNEVLKKGISKEQMINAVQTIKKHKIRLTTYNMIGIPFGSLKDDLDTLKLNIHYCPDLSRASITVIYKNTDLYKSLIKDNNKIQELYFKDKYICPDSSGYIPHERKINNLQKLFSLAVAFPFIVPIVPFLVRLPLRWFYAFIFVLYRGYVQYFRIWAGSQLGTKKYTVGTKEYFKILRRYLKER